MDDAVGEVEGDFPSTGNAYEFVLPSYEWAISRVDAANSRLQALISVAVTITLGFPVLAKAVLPSVAFESPLFWIGVLLFAGGLVYGVIAKARGGLDLVDLGALHEEWLADDPSTFKQDMIYFASEHQASNHLSVHNKDIAERWIATLLALQVIVWLIWFAVVS